MMRMRAVAMVAVFLLPGATGHGAMTQPRTRNAVDGAVAPWNSSVPESVPFMFWCAAPDAEAPDKRKVSGKHGQACFYFNNGCDISCDEWCVSPSRSDARTEREREGETETEAEAETELERESTAHALR